MEAYALPSSPILDGMPRGTGWYNDLSDFLVRVSEEHEQHMKEMSNLLQTLYKMEDRIERVWQCFWVLPDPAFDILKSLYVEGKLYDTVIKEQMCSKTAFEKRRKKGMQQLMVYYNSELPPDELIRIGQMKETQRHCK